MLEIVNFHEKQEYTHHILADKLIGYVMRGWRLKYGVEAQKFGAELDIPLTMLERVESGERPYPLSWIMAAAPLLKTGATAADILLEIHHLIESLKRDKILTVYDHREAVGFEFKVDNLPRYNP